MDIDDSGQNMRAHVYIEDINAPNVIFHHDVDFRSDLPFIDWLRHMEPIGPLWFRILWPVLMIISTIALIFAIVDIGIFLFRSVLWQWLIKEVLWQWLVLQIFTECLLKEVFKSFVAKLLGYSVLFIFGFFVFWLIKSGKWVDLFDFCSGLWQ